MSPYDPSNAFAKILRGEIPAHRLYEDERTLSFMDIMPRCDGHLLVIPKAPVRTILDAGPDDLSALFATVQRMARAAQRAFLADGLTIQQFNEPAGGQVVFHMHVHVLPRREGVPLRPHTGNMASNEVLLAQADLIRAALSEE